MSESALVDELSGARRALERLAALGVPVVLDDFGAGLSSLAALRDVPVAGIQIDRAFLIDADDCRSGRLMTTRVRLGHAMGLRVTAEGVETAAQQATVERAGCDLAQGYHHGRPRPAAATIAWLAARQDVHIPPPAVEPLRRAAVEPAAGLPPRVASLS